MEITECEEAVRRPGKFEGEPRYVPYFWSQEFEDYQQWKWAKPISCYKVSPEDKKLFPELRRRKVVKLLEDGMGFVKEVN